MEYALALKAQKRPRSNPGITVLVIAVLQRKYSIISYGITLLEQSLLKQVEFKLENPAIHFEGNFGMHLLTGYKKQNSNQCLFSSAFPRCALGVQSMSLLLVCGITMSSVVFSHIETTNDNGKIERSVLNIYTKY